MDEVPEKVKPSSAGYLQSETHRFPSRGTLFTAAFFFLVIALSLDGAKAYRNQQILSEATATVIGDRSIHLSAPKGLAKHYRQLESLCSGFSCENQPIKQCVEALGRVHFQEAYGLSIESIDFRLQNQGERGPREISLTARMPFQCFLCSFLPEAITIQAHSRSYISDTCQTT